MKLAAVIAAGGKGLRMGGDARKQYRMLGSKPVLAHSVDLFAGNDAVSEIVVAVPADDLQSVAELLGVYYPPESFKLVEGGETRQQSIYNALKALEGEIDLVCIHDAARPLASKGLLGCLVEAAHKYGAAIPVIPVNDTVKVIDESGFVLSTPKRESLRLVQTPQVFRFALILDAYHNALEAGMEATDDSALVEQLGKPVAVVAGELSNLKITSTRDLILATAWMCGEREALKQ